MSSLAVSYGAAAVTGGLNEDTWDDILISTSINYAVSSVGSAVGAELAAVEGGGGDSNYRSEPSSSGGKAHQEIADRSGEHRGYVAVKDNNGKSTGTIGRNWKATSGEIENLKNSGPVKLTDWNGNKHTFKSMHDAMNWSWDKSIGKGPSIQITSADAPMTVDVPRKREVSIVFYEHKGKIFATAYKGEWYEGSVSFNFHNVGNNDNVIATSHTHPFEKGEYVRYKGLGYPITGPQYPSGDDYPLAKLHKTGWNQVKSYLLYGKNEISGYTAD